MMSLNMIILFEKKNTPKNTVKKMLYFFYAKLTKKNKKEKTPLR